MKKMLVHGLSDELARRTADRALADYQQRFASYEPTLRWSSERRAELTFAAKGIKLSASIELEPGTIAVDLKVPLLLRPFQRRALAVVERELQHWIERAQNDQL